MNTTVIEARFNELQTAEATLSTIRETIQQKSNELHESETELARLDNLIKLKGDAQAMLDIVGVRATINGLKTHLADLRRAEAGASARRDEAEASHLEARINGLDVEGALTDEQLRAECIKVAGKVDKITHELFTKIDAHNKAVGELTTIGRKMNALRGREMPWEYSAFPLVHASSIHSEHVGKSYDRYMAPARKQAHQEYLKSVQAAGDTLREANAVALALRAK